MARSFDVPQGPRMNRRDFAGGAAALALAGIAPTMAAGATQGRSGVRPLPMRALARSRGGRAIDAALRRLVGLGLFAGTMLIAERDRVRFSGAYGLASREYDVPNQPATRFNLGSANKMFTATMILQLQEQGRLDVDDTVDRYVDSSWLDPALARQIRIRHLLTHTGGLSDYFTPEFELAPKTRYVNIDDFKPLLRASRQMFAPGTQWAYSNTGFFLLGVIASQVAGRDYYELVEAMIFGPAGMRATAALNLERVNSNYAQGYFKHRSNAPPQMGPPPPGATLPPPPSFSQLVDRAVTMQTRPGNPFEWRNNIYRHVARGGPSGGMYSNAADLARFCDALTDGTLVRRETAALMQSPKPPVAPHWGYGMVRADEGAWGHGGAFAGISSLILMYPDQSRLIILSNVDDGAYLAYHALVTVAHGP